jgi:hypothetical protein
MQGRRWIMSHPLIYIDIQELPAQADCADRLVIVIMTLVEIGSKWQIGIAVWQQYELAANSRQQPYGSKFEAVIISRTRKQDEDDRSAGITVLPSSALTANGKMPSLDGLTSWTTDGPLAANSRNLILREPPSARDGQYLKPPIASLLAVHLDVMTLSRVGRREYAGSTVHTLFFVGD